MKFEARITGLGGQGAITAGHIFGSAAALHEGKEVVVTEGYSPYVTGGWSRADVVIPTSPSTTRWCQSSTHSSQCTRKGSTST